MENDSCSSCKSEREGCQYEILFDEAQKQLDSLQRQVKHLRIESKRRTTENEALSTKLKQSESAHNTPSVTPEPQLAEIQDRHTVQVSALEQQHAKDVSAVKDRHVTEILALKERHSKDIKNLQHDFQKERLWWKKEVQSRDIQLQTLQARIVELQSRMGPTEKAGLEPSKPTCTLSHPPVLKGKNQKAATPASMPGPSQPMPSHTSDDESTETAPVPHSTHKSSSSASQSSGDSKPADPFPGISTSPAGELVRQKQDESTPEPVQPESSNDIFSRLFGEEHDDTDSKTAKKLETRVKISTVDEPCTSSTKPATSSTDLESEEPSAPSGTTHKTPIRDRPPRPPSRKFYSTHALDNTSSLPQDHTSKTPLGPEVENNQMPDDVTAKPTVAHSDNVESVSGTNGKPLLNVAEVCDSENTQNLNGQSNPLEETTKSSRNPDTKTSTHRVEMESHNKHTKSKSEKESHSRKRSDEHVGKQDKTSKQREGNAAECAFESRSRDNKLSDTKSHVGSSSDSKCKPQQQHKQTVSRKQKHSTEERKPTKKNPKSVRHGDKQVETDKPSSSHSDDKKGPMKDSRSLHSHTSEDMNQGQDSSRKHLERSNSCDQEKPASRRGKRTISLNEETLCGRSEKASLTSSSAKSGRHHGLSRSEKGSSSVKKSTDSMSGEIVHKDGNVSSAKGSEHSPTRKQDINPTKCHNIIGEVPDQTLLKESLSTLGEKPHMKGKMNAKTYKEKEKKSEIVFTSEVKNSKKSSNELSHQEDVYVAHGHRENKTASSSPVCSLDGSVAKSITSSAQHNSKKEMPSDKKSSSREKQTQLSRSSSDQKVSKKRKNDDKDNAENESSAISTKRRKHCARDISECDGEMDKNIHSRKDSKANQSEKYFSHKQARDKLPSEPSWQKKNNIIAPTVGRSRDKSCPSSENTCKEQESSGRFDSEDLTHKIQPNKASSRAITKARGLSDYERVQAYLNLSRRQNVEKSLEAGVIRTRHTHQDSLSKTKNPSSHECESVNKSSAVSVGGFFEWVRQCKPLHASELFGPENSGFETYDARHMELETISEVSPSRERSSKSHDPLVGTNPASCTAKLEGCGNASRNKTKSLPKIPKVQHPLPGEVHEEYDPCNPGYTGNKQGDKSLLKQSTMSDSAHLEYRPQLPATSIQSSNSQCENVARTYSVPVKTCTELSSSNMTNSNLKSLPVDINLSGIGDTILSDVKKALNIMKTTPFTSATKEKWVSVDEKSKVKDVPLPLPSPLKKLPDTMKKTNTSLRAGETQSSKASVVQSFGDTEPRYADLAVKSGLVRRKRKSPDDNVPTKSILKKPKHTDHGSKQDVMPSSSMCSESTSTHSKGCETIASLSVKTTNVCEPEKESNAETENKPRANKVTGNTEVNNTDSLDGPLESVEQSESLSKSSNQKAKCIIEPTTLDICVKHDAHSPKHASESKRNPLESCISSSLDDPMEKTCGPVDGTQKEGNDPPAEQSNLSVQEVVSLSGLMDDSESVLTSIEYAVKNKEEEDGSVAEGSKADFVSVLQNDLEISDNSTSNMDDSVFGAALNISSNDTGNLGSNEDEGFTIDGDIEDIQTFVDGFDEVQMNVDHDLLCSATESLLGGTEHEEDSAEPATLQIDNTEEEATTRNEQDEQDGPQASKSDVGEGMDVHNSTYIVDIDEMNMDDPINYEDTGASDVVLTRLIGSDFVESETGQAVRHLLNSSLPTMKDDQTPTTAIASTAPEISKGLTRNIDSTVTETLREEIPGSPVQHLLETCDDELPEMVAQGSPMDNEAGVMLGDLEITAPTNESPLTKVVDSADDGLEKIKDVLASGDHLETNTETENQMEKVTTNDDCEMDVCESVVDLNPGKSDSANDVQSALLDEDIDIKPPKQDLLKHDSDICVVLSSDSESDHSSTNSDSESNDSNDSSSYESCSDERKRTPNHLNEGTPAEIIIDDSTEEEDQDSSDEDSSDSESDESDSSYSESSGSDFSEDETDGDSLPGGNTEDADVEGDSCANDGDNAAGNEKSSATAEGEKTTSDNVTSAATGGSTSEESSSDVDSSESDSYISNDEIAQTVHSESDKVDRQTAEDNEEHMEDEHSDEQESEQTSHSHSECADEGVNTEHGQSPSNLTETTKTPANVDIEHVREQNKQRHKESISVTGPIDFVADNAVLDPDDHEYVVELHPSSEFNLDISNTASYQNQDMSNSTSHHIRSTASEITVPRSVEEDISMEGEDGEILSDSGEISESPSITDTSKASGDRKQHRSHQSSRKENIRAGRSCKDNTKRSEKKEGSRVKYNVEEEDTRRDSKRGRCQQLDCVQADSSIKRRHSSKPTGGSAKSRESSDRQTRGSISSRTSVRKSSTSWR